MWESEIKQFCNSLFNWEKKAKKAHLFLRETERVCALFNSLSVYIFVKDSYDSKLKIIPLLSNITKTNFPPEYNERPLACLLEYFLKI